MRKSVGASLAIVVALGVFDGAAAQRGGHSEGGQSGGGQSGGAQTGAAPAPAAPFRATGVYVPDSAASAPGEPSRGGGSGRAMPAGPFRSPYRGTPFHKRPWLWPLMFYNGIGFDYFYDDAPIDSDAFRPEDAAPGGLQLDVEPRRADVYVDGERLGAVSDFSGYYHHLSLPSGLHRIMVLADGYEPLMFEIAISPGRTTTYRGALMRGSGR